MKAIDADAHIDENEATFSYMEESEREFKPISMSLSEGHQFAGAQARQNRVWMINGNARLRRSRDDAQTHTTEETRQLIDVEARLRHMDELGIDVQVLYPTTFLHAFTSRADVELAVYRSYNRWLAERCALSHGRLRWAICVPTMSIPEAIKELEFGKENGACGVLKKGVELDERAASAPYFYPLYEAAERLDLPICFHQSTGNPNLSNAGDAARLAEFNVISAFSHIAGSGVSQRFPNLRWGFVEAGASWIPYMLKYLGMRGKAEKAGYDWKREFLVKNNYFVTCDTEDDVPALLEYGGEDSLMIGTDYSHADQSAEIEAHAVMMERAGKGWIPTSAAQKIVEDNARKFYGL